VRTSARLDELLVEDGQIGGGAGMGDHGFVRWKATPGRADALLSLKARPEDEAFKRAEQGAPSPEGTER
jgi:hypothetical protein